MIKINIFISLFILLILLYINHNPREFFSIQYNGIDTFDKYFFINLKHRTDRKEQIENEFKKINLKKSKIKRIDAIRNKYNGHIGAAKSHVKCLKTAKKMNLDNVIIFEDDFTFTLNRKEIDSKINTFLKKIGNDWDVIHLSSLIIDAEEVDELEVAKKVNHVTGGIAYIVNRHFFDKLQNNIQTSIYKMEEEMKDWSQKNVGKKKYETDAAFDQHWRTLQKSSKWYIFQPLLGTHSDKGNSSIMGSIEAFMGNYVKLYQLSV